MLRTRGVNAVNVKQGRGDADAMGEVSMGDGGGAGGSDGGNGGDGSEIGAAEHLARQLARVRSKFGMDPAATRLSLKDAWKDAWLSPTVIEGDEAEFIDAVADCLGAGLPLEAALTCWDTGELARDADDEEDENTDLTAAYVPHVSMGRRLLVR